MKQGLHYKALNCKGQDTVTEQGVLFFSFFIVFLTAFSNVISSITASISCWDLVTPDWKSSGSWQLKFRCITFTWVATKPWGVTINAIKKIQRIPVVFCGKGHDLNLKGTHNVIQKVWKVWNLNKFPKEKKRKKARVGKWLTCMYQ